MLNPTERPPPSLRAAVRRLHHPGAASRDDGQPRLREALPRLARRRVRLRAVLHARRAEDRDGGPVDRSTAWNPARNSEAISETSLASVSCVRRRSRRSSSLCASLTAGPAGRGRRPCPRRAQRRSTSEATATMAASRSRARRGGRAAARPQDPPRAEHVTAVEDRDRREVDEVEQEARVGERPQQVGVDRHRGGEARGRRRCLRRPARPARRGRSPTGRSACSAARRRPRGTG